MTLFEQLLLAHFVGDWLLQPTAMAKAKTNNWKVRSLHCLIITACFFPIALPWFCYIWIFATHWIIDTYKPLYWFRKLKGDYVSLYQFKCSFHEPDGFMVNVVHDQIFHILTLVPVILWAR